MKTSRNAGGLSVVYKRKNRIVKDLLLFFRYLYITAGYA